MKGRGEKMPKTYAIKTETADEIKEARKTIKDKQTDKRLRAVQLRGEGKTNKEIAEQLETSSDMVSRWVSAYAKDGMSSLLPKKRTGNHRNMSVDEEREFLAEYKKQAEHGHIVEVSHIEAAYEEKVGHSIGSGQIYRVLHRHGWRKVMPRSKHPNKASDEALEASKKLTLKSGN